MNEAEMAVRQTSVGNDKNAGAFITSARTACFNRLMGLSVSSAYRQPQLPGLAAKTKRPSKPNAPIQLSAEGRVNLGMFNP